MSQSTKPSAGHYTIRPLLESEWKNFRDLRLESLKEYPHVYYGDYASEEKQSESYWRDILGRQSHVFGLFDGDRMIGMASVSSLENAPGVPPHDDAVGVIGRVYVKPDYQKQGLAARLAQTCVDWSIENGTWVRLTAAHRVSNKPAQRLIAGLGVMHFATMRDKKYPNGDVEDEDWYHMDLTTARRQNPRLSQTKGLSQ